MKEYISENGITMIEGISFNWQKQPIYYNTKEPFVLSINVGGFFDNVTFHYDIDKKYISIHNDESSFKFQSDDLIFAEMFVLSYIKHNNLDIPPLYKK